MQLVFEQSRKKYFHKLLLPKFSQTFVAKIREGQSWFGKSLQNFARRCQKKKKKMPKLPEVLTAKSMFGTRVSPGFALCLEMGGKTFSDRHSLGLEIRDSNPRVRNTYDIRKDLLDTKSRNERHPALCII